MLFEWDEVKRQETIERRDVDLLYAAGIFDNAVVTNLDRRADYGEDRYISVGLVEDECFVVVHTQRGPVTRLITAWKGGRYVRENYEASIAGRHPANEGNG